MKRIIGVALGALFFVAGSAAVANAAVNWASASKPAVVTGYGSTVKGYGNFYLDIRNRKALSNDSVYLLNADNHQAYITMNGYFAKGPCNGAGFLNCPGSGDNSYRAYSANDSSHVKKVKTWTSVSVSTALNYSKHYGRGAFQVRIDVPWRLDPSSKPAVFTNGINY
jgi:hypothetical protein